MRKRKNPRMNGLSTVSSACHFHHNYLNHLFCLEQAKEFDIKKLNCHSVQQSRTLLIGPHFRVENCLSIVSNFIHNAKCQYLIVTALGISSSYTLIIKFCKYRLEQYMVYGICWNCKQETHNVKYHRTGKGSWKWRQIFFIYTCFNFAKKWIYLCIFKRMCINV